MIRNRKGAAIGREPRSEGSCDRKGAAIEREQRSEGSRDRKGAVIGREPRSEGSRDPITSDHRKCHHYNGKKCETAFHAFNVI